MAKRKPIDRHPIDRSANGVSERFFTPEKMFGLAAALIAAAIVYAGYWPADSTEVQSGAARYLAGMLILAGAIAMFVRPLWNEPDAHRSDRLIDIAAWGLALSMVISTWANADGANLRLGVNEMWWWVAAAALLSATRRICHCPGVVTVLLHLIMAVTLSVAVFGWHQQRIGIPEMIAMYESDPDAMLRAAGIQADEGSSLRIVFHNRLYDGGPTGTFALANSMAALLVGGLVVIGVMTAQRWSTMTTAQKVGWVSVVVIVGGMLIASRSRSAAGSLLIVMSIALTRRWWDGKIFTIAKVAAVAATVTGFLAAIAWKIGKDTEWVGQAPASLEVRWRYWIASIKMVAQSPWLGVGPGQFKARYELFRAAASTEQIADPHNWFWQIATTGGLVAAIIAIVLVAAIVWRVRAGAGAGAHAVGFRSGVLYIGAGIALAMIWIGGAVFGNLPTVDAAMLATIAGIAMVWLAIRSDPASVDRDSTNHKFPPERIAGYAALAIAIDLMAAGGLIVPGVAVPFWVLIAIATTPARVPCADIGVSQEAVPFRSRLVIGTAAATLMVAWYVTAVLPVEKASVAKGRFQVAWELGRVGEAEAALLQAAQADRWDAEPMMQLSAALAQIAAADSQNQARWESALREVQAEAVARSGRDPVAFRQIGDGQLRLFQRYGDFQTLRSAEDIFRQATTLAPSHEAYAAQIAEIYRKLGDDRAPGWAERAVTLSAAGGYYERSLPFVLVMPAEHFGDAVVQAEVRRPASEILPPILTSSTPQSVGSN